LNFDPTRRATNLRAVARKDSERTPEHHRGINDIIGVVLLAVALLLFIAMSSFEPKDVLATATDSNQTPHNWIGPVGAWLAHKFFQAFGAAAFVVPILCALFGLGCFFNALNYLRRRWPWGLVLFLCCVGFLSLFTDEKIMTQLGTNPKLATAGFFGWLQFMGLSYSSHPNVSAWAARCQARPAHARARG